MRFNWIVGIILLPIFGCYAPPAAPPASPPAPALSGGVWINGPNSSVLRGITVKLCDPNERASLVIFPFVSIQEKDEKFRVWKREFESLEENLRRRCSFTSKTDFNGSYQFNAPPGDYLILAYTYSDVFMAQWLQPVTITQTPKTFNLDETNAELILSR